MKFVLVLVLVLVLEICRAKTVERICRSTRQGFEDENENEDEDDLSASLDY